MSSPSTLRNRKKPREELNGDDKIPKANMKEETPGEMPKTEIKRQETTKKTEKKKRKNLTPDATYYISGWLFGRAMGIIYLVAFLSAWIQINGLIGSEGVSPIDEYFGRLSSNLSDASFFTHPSLFWISQSDFFLNAVMLVGTVASIGLLLDMIPFICALVCWVSFLSICNAGQNFFLYQWDLLLLESGFVMIFFHSFHWSLLPFSQNPRDFHPPRMLMWVLRMLLFKVHFSRGIMNLLHDGRTWRSLVAFDFFFETQPSPTIFSWYFHQLPILIHQGMAYCVLTVEVGVVFLIFGPQLLRRTGFCYLLVLQFFFIISGNHGTYFWNVLILCIPLLDDALFLPLIERMTRARRVKLKKKTQKLRSSRPRVWHQWISLAIALSIITLGLIPFVTVFEVENSVPRPIIILYQTVEPFRVSNWYNRLHKIPKDRYELVIQGSKDAQSWMDYKYLYKTGSDLYNAPPFISPHISRVEMALWSAAQSDYQTELWVSRLLHRILEGSTPVVDLFQKSPFPDEAPQFTRAKRNVIKFTYLEDTSGEWWSSEFNDLYTPSFSANSLSDKRMQLRNRVRKA